MTWKVSPDPVDFAEAIAWFRKRVPMTRGAYEQLTGEARARAFWISHVAQADLVGQALKALDDAVAKGTTLSDFKKAVGDQLRRAWGTKVDDHAWRLETIFRQNVQNAYSAGRYRQATDPVVLADRPVWMFDAILDARTTPICKACDGTKLEADNPWWQTHQPPLHFNCRSNFITLPAEDAGKLTAKAPKVDAEEGFGAPLLSDEPWTPEPGRVHEQLELDFSKKTADPPPAPPSQMREGVHVKKVVVGKKVAPDEADRLLASVKQPELLSFLEQQPLSELSFVQLAKIGRKKVFGWYQPSSQAMALSGEQAHDFYGKKGPLEPGKTWNLVDAAPTKAKAVEATFLHELGHHIHTHDRPSTEGRKKADAIIKAAFAKSASPLTRYAATDHEEYFAESFAAYYLHRAVLKAHDPVGFAMVEDVLRLRKILP